MNEPLVSVCSPCYNVGPYIGRFLDSLLAQTYKKIEVILVNDGATDNTGEIIESYIPRLEAEGYAVRYMVQENGGQSSAINNALKEVHGKYLAWPDPDDWLTLDSIRLRVEFMETHPQADFVRGEVEKIREEDKGSNGTNLPPLKGPQKIKHYLYDLINDKTDFLPVGNMMRVDRLWEVYPDREIYVNRKAGQNSQLMLPMAARYECWQIPDLVGYYCVRQDSHSHKAEYAYRMELARINEEVMLEALGTCRKTLKKYAPQVKRFYANKRLTFSLVEGDSEEAWKAYRELWHARGWTLRNTIRMFLWLYWRHRHSR